MRPIDLDEIELRLARDTDSPGVIALVGRCFRDYPGCVLWVNDEEPGLLAPASNFERFWVLQARDRIVGTIAAGRPRDEAGDRRVELKKLYVHPWLRGRSQGSRLVKVLENFAVESQATVVDLWSDTRFDTAHAVYEHLGFRATGRERELGDVSETHEWEFERRLEG